MAGEVKAPSGLDLQNTGKIINQVDPVNPQDGATRAWTLAQIAALVNGAPGLLDTLGEIATQLSSDESAAAALTTSVAGKVAKTLYDAFTVLTADTDDTPVATTLGASTVLGRRAAGGIVAISYANLLADLAAVTKYSAAIGDGAASSFNVDHNLNSRDCIVEVYQAATPFEKVLCDVQHSTVNRVIVLTGTYVPAAGELRVVVHA